MSLLSDITLEAIDEMAAVAGVAVTIGGTQYNAISITYDQETLTPDFSEKQKSSVQLYAADFSTGVPNDCEITEVESGTVHRVLSVKFRGHDFLCECEIRKARTFTGPFKK